MSDFSFYDRPMQEFGSQTLMSDFIKHLLANTPVPTVKCVIDSDVIISGCTYIYNHNIIKCTKTGVLGGQNREPLKPSNTLYPRNDLFPSNGETAAEYDIISRFDFGKEYTNITYRHISKQTYYNADDHYWLGQYLRSLYGVYGVNYMPYYNCYNTQALPNISDYYTSTEYIYTIPIRFNQIYTMSFQSTSASIIRPILYTDKPIVDFTELQIFDDAAQEEWNKLSQKSIISGRHYNNYYKFKFDANQPLLHRLEKYLYLLIKTNDPIESLAVLEGNYYNTNSVVTGNAGDGQIMSEVNTSDISTNTNIANPPDSGILSINGKLKLLQGENRNAHYAFSNRLVEGLLRHIINSQDTIQFDIGRVQDKLGFDVTNIWDDNIIVEAFKQYMATESYQSGYFNYLDISGMIDKDIEYMLFGNELSS